MVRCIPPEPAFVSAAEQDVWLALKASLRGEDVLVANLRLTDEQGDHEADLIVGMPDAGIAVIEVKGGSVTHDGQSWRQHGEGERRIDPVEQARRAKYALQNFLVRDTRWGYGTKVRTAHLVAFPYSEVHGNFAMPDCPRWMVLDRSDIAADPARMIWEVLNAQDSEAKPLTSAEADILVDCLGGRMRPQKDLVAVAADREATVDFLTAPQAAILSALRALPRVEVRGGAGSGKTWLAVETARRMTAEGKRVGLLCYSRGLAAYLQRRVSTLRRKEQPAYVGTFHSLGRRWGGPTGADDDTNFWENELPAAMATLAAELPPGQRFDAFIVDEAQDFADAWWPALLAALRDPEDGGLYVFADNGQRVFARQGRVPVNLIPVLLEENLRNTTPIAETFGPLAEMRMRYRGGAGDPVEFVECSGHDAIGAADDAVEQLLEEGYGPEHIALLTTGHRHPEQVERQARGQDSYWESFWDAEQVFYGHVLGFKGLERAAVVLAVDGFGDDRAKEKLYVGLSRARDRLVVCGDPAAIAEVGGPAVVRHLRGK